MTWKNVFPQFWQDAPAKPTAPTGGRRYFSPGTRAKLAAAAKARWARQRGATTAAPSKEKRSAHASRAKKALPVNEGSLGGTKESRRGEESSCEEKGRTHASRAKKALRANESAVGGQKESWSEEVTSSSKLALHVCIAPVRRSVGERGLLLARGLEPPRVSPYGPEPYASANSATRAQAAALQCARTRRPARLNQRHYDRSKASDVSLNQSCRFLRARTSN